MNLLIDVGHPAHVHYYRNLAKELETKGHKVVWTIKEMSIIKRLLDYYGFRYKVLPKKSDNLIGKIAKQLEYNLKLLNICLKEQIDLAIGTSVSVVHVSKISRINSIVFDDDDDDVQPFVTRFVNPFADVLLSPEALKGKRRRRDTIFYPGYHELAYLHPNRFSPDPSVLSDAGIKQGERYFIMRFNAFKAHHDLGVQGLSLEQKLKLVEKLLPHGRIFITTEREIEPELKMYQIPVAPEKIHSLMAFSSLFIGDSQTMTSEAAVLGVPSLRCNSFAGKISYLDEQEKIYGLTYAFQPQKFDQLLLKLEEMLAAKDLNDEFQKRRHRMLSEKIDVTSFWSWFVENYPKSVNEVKNNPEIYKNFK